MLPTPAKLLGNTTIASFSKLFKNSAFGQLYLHPVISLVKVISLKNLTLQNQDCLNKQVLFVPGCEGKLFSQLMIFLRKTKYKVCSLKNQRQKLCNQQISFPVTAYRANAGKFQFSLQSSVSTRHQSFIYIQLHYTYLKPYGTF